jgi:hypothetical protein
MLRGGERLQGFAIRTLIKRRSVMRKKTQKPKRRKPSSDSLIKTSKTSSDSLIKTSKKRDIELTEEELGKVSGGGWNLMQKSCVSG